MNFLNTCISWFRRHFVYDEIQDIRDFNTKFQLAQYKEPGHLRKWRLEERVDFMKEELQEFIDATKTQDLAGQADALIDLVYVAKGTAIMLGLPWEELWVDVQRANMAKELREVHLGDSHKLGVFKPLGWQGPKTKSILVANGYSRDYWLHDDIPDHIDEGVCRVN